jgi:signal transduction histidine kinase
VKDYGLGIPEEDRKHLFERFFRGKNVINIQGTGLGLHIVSKYVELMGGTIEVESELDKGTSFTIKFNI